MSRTTASLLILCLGLTACERTPAPLQLVAADPPAAPGALAPRLSADPRGGVIASWLEPEGSGEDAVWSLRWSRHGEGGWSPARSAASGSDWFINWADTPGVTAFDGFLVAHWLQKSGAATYAYDVRLALSTDEGGAWRALGTPHHDGTPTEHGFVSLFATPDGFGLTWLDGRNTAGGGHDAHHAGEAPAGAGMTLRAARFRADGTQLDEVELDALTCDCCPTDAVALADGPLLVYRDRTEAEIRDVQALRLTPGGWSAPTLVHADGWRMPGCPVNGPAVAADGEQVAVAWFTAAGDVPKVLLAWSADGGQRFAPPLQVDAGRPLGRVELVMLPDGEVLVMWLEQVGEVAELRARRGTPAGHLREPQTLASTSAGRASGFPRATASTDGVWLTWTEVDGHGTRRVRAGRLSL